jgi:hypothetical protein
MSVIFVADSYDTIRRTMRCVLAQTAREQLEAVIVTPAADRLAADRSELESFVHRQIVEVGSIESLPWARAQGIRRAKAPLVVLTESHSYPDPRWAESLIEAHRGPWAAVGPVLRNANPQTMLSWAALLIAYGPWVEGARAGAVDDLPGHNSSYKRELLIRYGDRLEELMEMESALHRRLREDLGGELYLEPAAITYHENVSRPRSFFRVRFHSGRLFAAARSEGWSTLRRLAYSAGAPLIPAVRLRRFVRDLRRPGARSDLLPRLLPALVVGLTVSSAGEMVGYLLGPGSSTAAREDIELHREHHVAD